MPLVARSFLVVTLAAASLLAGCNRAGQDGGVVQANYPVLPQADLDRREKVRRDLAVELKAQRQQLLAGRAQPVEAKPLPKRALQLAALATDDKPALSPTAQTQLALVTPSPVAITKPDIAEQDTAVPRERKGLQRFHAKLAALEDGRRAKPITILHLGDSHVASDSFSRGIRRAFQARYGDAGRGMVIPAKAFKYGVADQISMRASGAWKSRTALKIRKGGGFGLSGVSVTSAQNGAVMKLVARKQPFDEVRVTVMTGPKLGRFKVTVGNKSEIFSARAAKWGSKQVVMKAKGRRLSVTALGGGAVSVLNWSTLRNRPGIRYVNFGLIGATVSITQRFSEARMLADIKRLDPDLIIYGYGTNEGFQDGLKLSAYVKEAKVLTRKFLKAAPNADLVYVGAASGLRKRGKGKTCGGGWRTPPKLDAVRKAVRGLAKEQNAAYWDWAQFMGGRCGINAWAGQGLAARDRVHLTPKGYAKSAQAFARFLMRPSGAPVTVASN
ncbi:MAG: GDSL-type esterase/lipase family protein [Pseudomonadota bacterium]